MGKKVLKKDKIQEEKLVPKEEVVSKKEIASIKEIIPKEKTVLKEEVSVIKSVEKNVTNKKKKVLVERYDPDIKIGLTKEDVEKRVTQGLNNITSTGSNKTIIGIIIGNTFNFFNIVTFGIAAWLVSANARLLELNFLIVVIINLIIGIIQEIKAKKTIDSLSLLSAPVADVIRNGRKSEIEIDNIVIDDIIYLVGGKQISADAIMKEGVIEVNESLLTGESDVVVKHKGDKLFSGSFVVSGSGHAQVSAVGKDNYVQKLASQAKKYKKPKSELLSSLKIIMRFMGVIIFPIGITLFLMMSKNDEITYQEVVLKTSGAIIGMIPLGLFLLSTSALAIGVIRLAKRKTLVQELYCIEMLARIDVLCLDKTGTITDGTMTVQAVHEFDHKVQLGMPLKSVMSAILNAQKEKNLTSKSLEKRFGTARKIKCVAEIPFSSARKYSAVSFEKQGTFVLGAPEIVIKKTATNDSFFEEANRQAEKGYRTIVVAHSKEKIENDKLVGNLTPLALIMIEDNVRPDAIETIDYFKNSGVDVKVISGDNAATVSKIAQRAGINNAQTYISLDGLTDSEVANAASKYTVFGRVSPEQKKILVKSLKKKKHTVAMTGDGVNDILALKEADTSIALASGSEAARNVAHLVLLDSNFSSMPVVVTEGRRVINNIQKLSGLFLAKTLFTLFLAIVAITQEGIYPISPNQLSAINYLVVGIPTFFLAMEANNNLVKGKFIINVLKGALPGALVILFNSLVILWLSNALGMNPKIQSTLIVLLATFTMFALLLKVSLPFNKMRLVLFFCMVGALVIILWLRPDLISINAFPGVKSDDIPLNIPQILLLISLTQAIWPLLYIFNNIYKWTKNVVASGIKFISRTQHDKKA